MIHLCIHGVNTLALVDTGSPCTLMSEGHFRFICDRAHRQLCLELPEAYVVYLDIL